jgi:hypothetical protein
VIRVAVAAVAAALALVAARAAAVDLSYASAAELTVELAARDLDITRTAARIDDLVAREARNASAIDAARTEVLESERALAERAGFLYRLSRRGAAFRYLLGAPTASAFLERYAMLRRLVVAQLEARRQAGARLAAAEGALADTRRQLQSARAMLSQLEEARAELAGELARRSSDTLAWR